MFEMKWKITIGKYTLNMLESVEIVRSVELLSDTAVITLPATVYNQALDVNSLIKRKDKVAIWLGYDDNLVQEFDGYVDTITTDGGSLKLTCEDGIFQYRVTLDDTELKAVTAAQIITYVNKKVSAYYPDEKAFTLSCDYDFTYDKFVISNATGYDILKKIQEEAKPNVYLKDRVLHVHPQYEETFGEASYDFSVNIETSDLKYKKANERKVYIEIEYQTKDGQNKKVQYGDKDGDKISLKGGTTNTKSLQLQAKEEYKSRVYDGFEGSFTSWLIPYCDAGYKVSIRDKEHTDMNGKYYGLEVKTTFSESGGIRTIKIGKAL